MIRSRSDRVRDEFSTRFIHNPLDQYRIERWRLSRKYGRIRIRVDLVLEIRRGAFMGDIEGADDGSSYFYLEGTDDLSGSGGKRVFGLSCRGGLCGRVEVKAYFYGIAFS